MRAFTKKSSNRFDFDGDSLLLMVKQYRSNTKGRNALNAQVQDALHTYYKSIGSSYQPADFSKPLHEHWTTATKALRPSRKRSRPPIRRKVLTDTTTIDKENETPSTQKEKAQLPLDPFGDLDEQLNLEKALEFAVTVISKYHSRLNERDGVRALSERSGYWLRSMQIDGDVSDTKMNVTLGVAYMYLLGRVIPQSLLWGKGTITAVNNRLQWHEKTRRGKRAQDMAHRYHTHTHTHLKM